MQSPALLGVLMAMGAVIAAYWMGHSAGFQAGQGEGYDEGKREGAKEGSMRGYAVGFDRGKRGQSDEGGDESGSRLRLGIVGLLLAAAATFTLASNSHRNETRAPKSTRNPQSLMPSNATNLPFEDSNRPLPSESLELTEPADTLRSMQSPHPPTASEDRRLIPVQEDLVRDGMTEHRALLPVPTTGPPMTPPAAQVREPNGGRNAFDLPPIQSNKPTW